MQLYCLAGHAVMNVVVQGAESHQQPTAQQQCNGNDRLEFYDLLTLTFLLFFPLLSVLLPLELFVYLRLITGTLFLCISAHLTVLLLSNPVLNLIFSLLPITSSHSHASASDLTIDFWRYINISLTLTLTNVTCLPTHTGTPLRRHQQLGKQRLQQQQQQLL